MSTLKFPANAYLYLSPVAQNEGMRASPVHINLTSWFKQSLLLFMLLLFCGRLGLLLHEFIGHGLLAKILQLEIRGWHLFLFGGGRISYAGESSPLASFLISSGGVVVELLAGVLLLGLGCWKSLSLHLRRLSSCLSVVLIIHALFYLQDSLWYRYGDGQHIIQLSHWTNGISEAGIALLILLLLSTHLLFRSHARPLIIWIQRNENASLNITFILAVLCAILLHGTLTYTEERWFHDQSYTQIMKKAHDKKVEDALHKYKQDPTLPQDKESIEKVRKQLEKKHAPFPIRWLTFPGLVLAALSGFYRSRKTEEADSIGHRHPYPLIGLLTIVVMGLTLLLKFI